MKMHLVLAAAFAGLGSHAAFASSEGGDTWSELEPTPYAGSAQALAVPAPGPVSSQQREELGAASGRSEGGDTWSELEPTPYAGSARALAVPAPGPVSSQ